MALKRKNVDEMSIKVNEQGNRVVVETLLRLLMDVESLAVVQRPFLGLSDIIERKTMNKSLHVGYIAEQGDTLIRSLFNLPYVQEVRFKVGGMDFEAVIYPPYDLKNKNIALIVTSEIKACVDRAAGKTLALRDDLTAESCFEECPACAD